MSSSQRLNYTAIGDNVNLAARLEGVNKIYGSEILVSKTVYELCRNEFYFRPLDKIQVRGKSQLTMIYELIAAKEGILPQTATEEEIELCQLSTEAYEAYQEKNIEKVKQLFEKILQYYPNDPMVKYYRKNKLK